MSDNDPAPEEAQFITAAYSEKVREAFLAFAENLSVGQSEHSCKERFLRSLAMIKKARNLALRAIIEGEEASVQAAQPQAPEEAAGDGLSEEDRALIEQALSGTTGASRPVRLR